MKRKTMIILYLICAACNAALGILILRQSLSGDGRYVPVGVGWLLIAAAWAVHAVILIVQDVRESRKKQQQGPKASPDEGL